MTAGAELQAAIVGVATEIPELTGVYDGPPARAEFPYLVVDCGTERPWPCSPYSGQEVTVALTLWDDQGARLFALEQLIEARNLAPRSLPSWEISSLLLTEKKKTRSAAGPWASHLTMRARLLSKAGD